MEQRLRQIMADALNIQFTDINEETSIDNVENWDSLGHLRLTTAIEEHFNIKFKEEDFLVMTSYRDIKQILEKRGVSFE